MQSLLDRAHRRFTRHSLFVILPDIIQCSFFSRRMCSVGVTCQPLLSGAVEISAGECIPVFMTLCEMACLAVAVGPHLGQKMASFSMASFNQMSSVPGYNQLVRSASMPSHGSRTQREAPPVPTIEVNRRHGHFSCCCGYI